MPLTCWFSFQSLSYLETHEALRFRRLQTQPCSLNRFAVAIISSLVTSGSGDGTVPEGADNGAVPNSERMAIKSGHLPGRA
jgi:hypothetical protein